MRPCVLGWTAARVDFLAKSKSRKRVDPKRSSSFEVYRWFWVAKMARRNGIYTSLQKPIVSFWLEICNFFASLQKYDKQQRRSTNRISNLCISSHHFVCRLTSSSTLNEYPTNDIWTYISISSLFMDFNKNEFWYQRKQQYTNTGET